MIFRDRYEAGKQLVQALDFLKGRDDLIVLAIPRGGVVVGYEIARALGAPLDLWITHKLGAPGNPEYAIGAVAGEDTVVLDEEAVAALGVSQKYLDAEIERERDEIRRRMQQYRGDRPLP